MEIIRVEEYRIHDKHNSYPLAPTFVKNNLAILKLACDIGKENFHKIVLPRKPFFKECRNEKCFVMVFRRMRKTNWVMFQMYAPNTTESNRSKKETTMNDVDTKETRKYRINEIIKNHRNDERFKRKLAEPPNFASFYESQEPTKIKAPSTNLTLVSTSPNSLVHQATAATPTVLPVTDNSSLPKAIGLDDDEIASFSDFIDSGASRRTILPRSLGKRFGCAHTGAPVMLDGTQCAITVVPCDNRQTGSEWAYADLYENLDWINQVQEDWSTEDNSIIPAAPPRASGDPFANHSSKTCSTCIFNFFIDLGCKDKKRCGNKSTSIGTSEPHDYQRAGGSIVFEKSTSCNGSSKNTGIDVGISRGCRRKNQESRQRAESRKNWPNSPRSGEPTNPRDPAYRNVAKARRPVPITVASPNAGRILKGQSPVLAGKDKSMREDYSRMIEIPKSMLELPPPPSSAYTSFRDDDKKHERANNEIGLQNIEGHSNYWIGEHENSFGITSEAKRRLIQSARASP
ncbi:uncharacterized protein [Venturia canescens]|uniref:uncharacterized protein n=1 Tax=Venturia canescens TaxID=32260 RepID=UPI001C9D52AD|nr:uncharacterized protein LOC122410587 [Venturia canescens]